LGSTKVQRSQTGLEIKTTIGRNQQKGGKKMAVRRKILTLTLIGLMAAFMGPICANAADPVAGEQAPTLIEPVEDAQSYDLTPTFKWTSISGATAFDLTIGAAAPVTIDDKNLVKDGEKYYWVAKDKAQDRVAATEADAKTAAATLALGSKNCFTYTAEGTKKGQTWCFYEYTPAADLTKLGDVDWSVKAKRAAEKNNFDGTTNDTTADGTFSLYDDVVLSMEATPAQVTAGATDPVKVAVSLDNSPDKSGGVSVESLTFSVEYNADLLVAPTTAEKTARVKGTVAVTSSGTGATAKATVVITGEVIAAETGEIVSLAFKAKEGATGGDVTFKFADVAVKSDTVDPTPLESNPANSDDTAATKVLPAVTPGAIISGADTTTTEDDIPELIDAVVALKVVTALPLTDAQKTAVTKYANGMGRPVGVQDALIVFDALAK